MRARDHEWRPIGKGWYFCSGCQVWRHKDVLDRITGWGHRRSALRLAAMRERVETAQIKQAAE